MYSSPDNTRRHRLKTVVQNVGLVIGQRTTDRRSESPRESVSLMVAQTVVSVGP